MERKRKGILWTVVILAAVAAIGWGEWTHRVPSNSVLEIDLDGQIEEQRPASASSILSGDILVLHELTDAVDSARDDKRVAGLIVRIGDVDAGWAKIQELSAHIEAFRKSGKPSVCLLEEDYNDNRAYNIATACDQVWMLPSATLGVTGMMTESTFFRGALDKSGVKADYAKIAEYKTYVNMYTEKKYTPAQREMDESLMTSTLGQYAAAIAANRRLDPVNVEELLRGGPYPSDEATDKKLIDKAAYWDDVEDYFDKKLGADNWSTIDFTEYGKQIRNSGTESIAVVYATGEVDSGESDWNPLSGFVLGADSAGRRPAQRAGRRKYKSDYLPRGFAGRLGIGQRRNQARGGERGKRQARGCFHVGRSRVGRLLVHITGDENRRGPGDAYRVNRCFLWEIRRGGPVQFAGNFHGSHREQRKRHTVVGSAGLHAGAARDRG